MIQANATTTNNGVASRKSERIASHDFQAWDRYDADNEAEKVDKNEKSNRSSPVTVSPSGIPIELSDKGKLLTSHPTTPHILTHTHTHTH